MIFDYIEIIIRCRAEIVKDQNMNKIIANHHVDWDNKIYSQFWKETIL